MLFNQIISNILVILVLKTEHKNEVSHINASSAANLNTGKITDAGSFSPNKPSDRRNKNKANESNMETADSQNSSNKQISNGPQKQNAQDTKCLELNSNKSVVRKPSERRKKNVTDDEIHGNQELSIIHEPSVASTALKLPQGLFNSTNYSCNWSKESYVSQYKAVNLQPSSEDFTNVADSFFLTMDKSNNITQVITRLNGNYVCV